MLNIPAGKLVIALSLSVGVFISHGFSLFAVAACLYACGIAFTKGPLAVVYIAVFLGGMSLLSFDSSFAPALITAGAVLVIVFSTSTISRFLFFLSGAAVLLSGTIQGMAPLTAALLAASLIKREKWRSLIIAGGLMAILIISGLPTTTEHQYLVSEEVMIENGVIWTEPVEINLGMPELLLQAPRTDAADITIMVSGGGVRDNSAVGYIASGDRTYQIYPGENDITIEEPIFPVSIRVSRSWKPFTHPIIHFSYAKASL